MDVLSRVGGSLLSATFDSLFEKFKEYLSDQLFRKLNEYLSDQLQDSKEEVHAQMESWKTLLPKITTILQHAEENQVAKLFVKSCLDDLKDLAYDMEDILEEFVIDAKRSELIAEFDARANKRQKTTSNVMNLFRSKAKPNQKINSMVNHLNVRFQRIEKEMHTFGLINLIMKVEDNSHKVAMRKACESAILEDQVYGRDSDKKAILDRLLEDGGSLEQDFVIPIVGMGGLGKTTLARLIYNDEKLKGRFDLKAWVCVSDEFDVARITRTILEHVTRERCDFDFGLLQEKLREELSGRKFFLVLDDVWSKEYGQWDVLKRLFMSGSPRSKIIVTTRNKDVGTMMRGDDGVYNLELLQDDACLPLFTRHALGKENFDAHLDLQDVGEKLVERCKRLPLALKTLSGVLRGKLRRDEWEDILNSDIWSSSEDRSGILPALRLSYNHLPSHLKRCFAYCALFPKGYEFDKKVLVRLWMAEGLLQQQSCRKKKMKEEIGHQYFQDLLSRSLFQQSSKDGSQFVMHDLINDLAVDVAGEAYCNLECSIGDKKLEKARHLSFTPHHHEVSRRFMVLDNLKQLRTFLPLGVIKYRASPYLSNRIWHDFLPTLNHLRVLSLCNYQISKLPDSFENLKHIRYLDLSNIEIEYLPESVGFLLFLQTLLLSGCQKLTKLPTMIGNLIDLHHLDITDTPSLKEMPSGIGNLKNLVTLSKFIVGKASGMMMRLSNLKNLSQLQGRLSILDLQNVFDVQDAREANLDKIHGLEELVLEWTNTNNYGSISINSFWLEMWATPNNDQDESILQMQVLSWLKPHSNLRSLTISYYHGENFPLWVCDPFLFFNLSFMKLSNCLRCTLLPSLGLLPVLKELIIEGMHSIKGIGFNSYGQHGSFPSLAKLVFRRMSNWEEWTSPAGSACEFPRLHKLVIEYCPKLGQLPSNLSSLKELDVTYCNDMLLQSMGDLTLLTNLRIKEISKLTCLSMSMSLPSLKELSIEGCNEVLLKSMVNLTSLTILQIVDLKALTCLPKSFTQSLIALETLDITNCNDLTCLWEEGTEIEQSLLRFNLKHLRLNECGALESLPDAMVMRMNGSNSSNASMLMSRLETLEICGCNSLKSFPRGKFVVESLLDVDGHYNNNNRHDCKILKSLRTLDCVNILVKLSIFLCKALESLPKELGFCTPNLKELKIQWCENFKSLPNTMYGLKSLQRLWMEGCPDIEFIPDGGLPPNLTDLVLGWCKNLKFVPKTMYQLRSLQILVIPGGALTMGLKNLTSLRRLTIEQKIPLDIVLPSSLRSLLIWNQENLESIPGGLFQNLSSLEELCIDNCLELRSLPREAFPSSLVRLRISMCPLLIRQRFEAKGDYWTLTHSIPWVEIDHSCV